MKILLVEDEPKVSSFIREALEEYQYQVDVAYDGMEGQKLGVSGLYDLIILDVIVPKLNGFEVSRLIREFDSRTPILMLTALGTTEDIVSGFDSGADDYLVKPFQILELVARIKALTKRSREADRSARVLRVANMELNIDRRNVVREGVTIELTAKEFMLLEFFMRNKDRVLSRAEIAKGVWDVEFDTGTNIVDVYINFIRKKVDKGFEPKLIHTLIGSGYLFGEKQ